MIIISNKWLYVTLTFGFLIASIPLGYSKGITVNTVSFTGIVPDIRCKNISDSELSFLKIDKNGDGRLSRDEFSSIRNHDFSIIDFDSNGYISPIEFSVYKKRNCLQ